MRILFRPDLSPSIGAGHAMRDLAVAEELIARGHFVQFACDTFELAWVEDAIRGRGCSIIDPPPGSLAELAEELRSDVVVVDSYTLPTDDYLAVMRVGIPLVSVVDFDRHRAVGDLVVDPSPSLSGDDFGGARRVLAGLPYAMVRREFRQPAQATAEGSPLRVLVAFGGTDALGASATMARVLLELAIPMALTVVARDDLVEEIVALPRVSGQTVTIVSAGGDFASLVARQDLVVSAAGSTSLELLALGAAVGLVCVADNQGRYYEALAQNGAAVAVATIRDLRTNDPAIATVLRGLIEDPERRRTLRAAASVAVDGNGPRRIADALLSLEGRPLPA